MDTPTKANVFTFIGYMISKGLVNTNTGNGLKAAFNKILENYGPEDDISGVDVEAEVIRYNNRHPGALSPDSLNQYRKRVTTVLNEFSKWSSNPMTYKGMGGSIKPVNGKSDKTEKSAKRKPNTSTDDVTDVAFIEQKPTVPAKPNTITATVTDTSLVMPFPLRPTFLAQIVIPHDLTKSEAARLNNFIMALARDD